MKNTITIKNITMKYADFYALKDINIVLEPGIYGLIGPNGAGKSTLISILSTLIKPSAGQVLFKQEDISSIQNTYRTYIGLMPQSQKGYDEFKAIHFMYYMAMLKGYEKKEATNDITKLLAQVGLTEYQNNKIKSFSGGMRQRLMFAQALLNNPKILILDEPTAGLDPHERIRMRNFIAGEAKDKIVIIATHVMQDIESIANEVILIKRGEIVYKGRQEELLQELSGFIVEKRIDEQDLAQYQKEYKISNVSKLDHGLYIRYINTIKEKSSSIPTLEEAYLYYLTDT